MGQLGKYTPGVKVRDFWTWNTSFDYPPLNWRPRFPIQVSSQPGGAWPAIRYWSTDGKRSDDGTYDYWRWNAPPGYGDCYAEFRMRPTESFGTPYLLLQSWWIVLYWEGIFTTERGGSTTGAPIHQMGFNCGLRNIVVGGQIKAVWQSQSIWSSVWADYPLDPPPL